MPRLTDSQRPIGYWLKEADRALTEHIDRAQAANGVSRIEWQVLNSLEQAVQVTPAALAASLHMFVDPAGIDSILAGLRARGWIEDVSPQSVTLTGEGTRRHVQLLARQREIRERAMTGISPEDYSTAVRVLHRIVANLDGEAGGAWTSSP